MSVEIVSVLVNGRQAPFVRHNSEDDTISGQATIYNHIDLSKKLAARQSIPDLTITVPRPTIRLVTAVQVKTFALCAELQTLNDLGPFGRPFQRL